jgi:DNA-binding NtrC family response regulator
MEKILIVDDIERQRLKYKRITEKAIGACKIFMDDNGKDALERIKSEPDISVVILDIDFSKLPEDKIISSDPHREGYIIAHHLRKINPDLQIVLTTCLDELDEPFVIRLDDTPSDIKQKIKLAMRIAQLERDNKELRRLLYAVKTDEVTIVGQSESLMKVLDNAQKAAVGDDKEPILIMGESGTGKELLAKFIYHHSARKEKPFITVNCAAIPDNLIESEFFGTEKGAATGVVAKPGKLELADGGMLFLDEIGDMRQEMQAKMLRVLEHGGFERLGGVKTIKPDIRFIFATNKDLQAKMNAGRFRLELYYRLGVLHLYMPPLRERKEDIPLLVAHFLNEIAKEGEKPKGLSPELMKLFINYHWPGNVRELEHKVRGMAIMSENEILDVTDLSEDFKNRLQEYRSKDNQFEIIDEKLSRFPESEKTRMLQLFTQTEGTVTREEIIAALDLGGTAANERIQMFKNLGLIQMEKRKYRKTGLLDSYWNWRK